MVVGSGCVSLKLVVRGGRWWWLSKFVVGGSGGGGGCRRWPLELATDGGR